MSFSQAITLALGAILVDNFVFSRFLGVGSVLKAAQSREAAWGVSLSMIPVTTLTAVFAYLVNEYLLVPARVPYLQTMAFLLIAVTTVQLLGRIMRRFLPAVYEVQRPYLPALTANSAVFGVLLLGTAMELGFAGAVTFGLAAGLGFALAALLLASIGQRPAYGQCPAVFEGVPLTFITAALISLAFSGFIGLKLW